MNNTHLFCNTLFFCLLTTHTVFTMQRSDDPNVLNDVIEFAKKMPYATGALLCKDGAMGTVIFLNETTAITSAHHFKGRARAAHIVIACDEYDIWYTRYSHNWDLTLQNVKDSGAPWACIKQQYSMTKFSELGPKYTDLNDCTPKGLSELQKLWEDAQAVCFSKDISFDDLEGGNPYSLNGPDISVLKLRTPITLTKKTIALQAISKNIFDRCKAYSFGFAGVHSLNDGQIHNKITHKEDNQGVTIPLICFLADNIQQSEDGKYAYSKLYSAGGQDEQFMVKKLPALDGNNRFIGLMMSGMSGGPLLFQISEDEYVLGGINVQTTTANAKVIVNHAIATIEENYVKPNNEKNNALMKEWQSSIKPFGEAPWPIYNIFQLITPEVVAFIEKIMAL